MQEPTYINPNEIAANVITSRGAFASLSIGVSLLRIWHKDKSGFNGNKHTTAVQATLTKLANFSLHATKNNNLNDQPPGAAVFKRKQLLWPDLLRDKKKITLPARSQHQHMQSLDPLLHQFE